MLNQKNGCAIFLKYSFKGNQHFNLRMQSIQKHNHYTTLIRIQRKELKIHIYILKIVQFAL
jgi:hypothetical protein